MGVHGRAPEAGFTLMELLISSMLTLVVLVMAYGLLEASTRTADAIGRRSVNAADARESIDALEANLRFSNGVWVCADGVSACETPVAPAAWTRTSGAALYVTNASGGNQPSCAKWTLSAGGLEETTSARPGVILTVAGVMAWAGSPTSQTTGFALPLPRLVVIDLLVNASAPRSASPKAFAARDPVSVHDFISPANLPVTWPDRPPANC